VLAASLPWNSWRVSLADGTELFNLPLAQVADNPGVRIRWSELYRVLRSAAGHAVHYGCELTSIGPATGGTSRTRLSWQQASTTHEIDNIDLLVGAK
jgi:salicylate hydroxylase